MGGAAGKRPKRSKSLIASRRSDREEGRSEQPTEEEYKRMVPYRSFVGE